jgi:hypothetical protein
MVFLPPTLGSTRCFIRYPPPSQFGDSREQMRYLRVARSIVMLRRVPWHDPHLNLIAVFTPDSLKEWTEVAKSVLTIAAILFGGVIALFRFRLFRMVVPCLALNIRIKHVETLSGYLLLIELDVKNLTPTKVQLRNAELYVKPFDDADQLSVLPAALRGRVEQSDPLCDSCTPCFVIPSMTASDPNQLLTIDKGERITLSCAKLVPRTRASRVTAYVEMHQRDWDWRRPFHAGDRYAWFSDALYAFEKPTVAPAEEIESDESHGERRMDAIIESD